jgi:hypothetical protein
VYQLDDGRQMVLDYGIYRDKLYRAIIINPSGDAGAFTDLLQ